jgi:hypothetical protein
VTDQKIQRLLLLACILGLVALALMIWSILVPTVLPVMVAMSIGQIVGTLSLGVYGLAVVLDLRRARVLARESEQMPPEDRA